MKSHQKYLLGRVLGVANGKLWSQEAPRQGQGRTQLPQNGPKDANREAKMPQECPKGGKIAPLGSLLCGNH